MEKRCKPGMNLIENENLSQEKIKESDDES
jgi:hypothetical protein